MILNINKNNFIKPILRIRSIIWAEDWNFRSGYWKEFSGLGDEVDYKESNIQIWIENNHIQQKRYPYMFAAHPIQLEHANEYDILGSYKLLTSMDASLKWCAMEQDKYDKLFIFMKRC